MAMPFSPFFTVRPSAFQVEAGDVGRILALQADRDDVAKAVAVKARLHGEQSFPIVAGDDVGDPLLQLLQQRSGLLGARGSFGRFGCCLRASVRRAQCPRDEPGA
jgi:hypothetical protein